MRTNSHVNFEKVLNMAVLLPQKERKKLISALQKEISEKKERKFGKYEGKGYIAKDFNEPIEEFKGYMP